MRKVLIKADCAEFGLSNLYKRKHFPQEMVVYINYRDNQFVIFIAYPCV